jgi:hypothetical protein
MNAADTNVAVETAVDVTAVDVTAVDVIAAGTAAAMSGPPKPIWNLLPLAAASNLFRKPTIISGLSKRQSRPSR